MYHPLDVDKVQIASRNGTRLIPKFSDSFLSFNNLSPAFKFPFFISCSKYSIARSRALCFRSMSPPNWYNLFGYTNYIALFIRVNIKKLRIHLRNLNVCLINQLIYFIKHILNQEICYYIVLF